MLHHAQTRDYVARRTQQGKTNSEIRRCLMRHIARGIHPLLIADLTDTKQSALTQEPQLSSEGLRRGFAALADPSSALFTPASQSARDRVRPEQDGSLIFFVASVSCPERCAQDDARHARVISLPTERGA